MADSPFNIPILFLIFNRPDNTARVFDSIRNIRPSKLFIAADGPRNNVTEDQEKCSQARKVVSNIDWPCEVKILFQEKNLGCGYGVSTAINWFFDNVDGGIILEDDCLPNESFFYFCEELLNRYKDDNKIMHISGNNFQEGKKRGSSSYYFSKYTHNWGWATWRRAWQYNDFELTSPEERKRNWDKQWLLSVNTQNGLAVLPNVNLVSNIGFGDQATHTFGNSKFSNMAVQPMIFPLVHPKDIARNKLADFFTYRRVFGGSFRSLGLKTILPLVPRVAKSAVKRLVKK